MVVLVRKVLHDISDVYLGKYLKAILPNSHEEGAWDQAAL